MDTRQVALRNLTRLTRWVVLDIETTNSDDGQHVLSIGINQWRMDASATQPTPGPVEWFVDPGVRIENTRVHRINAQTLKDKHAQPFAYYINKLNTVLKPRAGERVVLVAHWARFDVGVLHLEYGRAGLTFPDVLLLDTWRLAHWLDASTTGYNLPALLACYGLSITNHHNAAADAADTAELLRKLISDAVGQGVSDLGAKHPTKAKHPVLGRTSDIDSYQPGRGQRTERRSGFVFIERPDAHRVTHKALAKNPSKAALDTWLTNARACAELRCPALTTKVEHLRSAKEAMLAAFLTDWDAHLATGQIVAANTSLGAVLTLLPKVESSTAAHSWYATWGPKLRTVSRCVSEPTTGAPVDACPDCRAHRGCPADTWTHDVAALYVGAGSNFNARNRKAWMTPNGSLEDLVAAGESDIAAHAAWRLVEMLTRTKPNAVDADNVAAIASDLGLVSPWLARWAAHKAEAAGDRVAALALIDKAIPHQVGSTDPAWADLLSYRDAVAARQVAAGRVPTGPAPYRTGHTAPADRPDRRRFQLATTPAVQVPARPGARKRRLTSLRGSPRR